MSTFRNKVMVQAAASVLSARRRADVAEAQNQVMRAALESVLENRNYTDRIVLTVTTALTRVDDLEKD